MNDFYHKFVTLIKRCRIRFTADLLLILSFCLIASVSMVRYYAGTGPEPEGVLANAEPVMLAGNERIEVSTLVQIPHSGTDDIRYVVRNTDGTPSATMRVVNGIFQADEPGTGYLYVYVNGEASRNCVPIHVYETLEQKEEAILVHQQLKENETNELQAQLISEPEEVPLVMTSEETAKPGNPAVLFQNVPAAAGLSVNHIQNYYTTGSSMVFVSARKDDVSDKPALLTEVCSITAWLGQKGNILPRIWIITPEGERSLVDSSAVTWESSDPSVIAVENNELTIAGEGETVLTGTHDEEKFEIRITVNEPEEISDFATASADPYTLGFSEDSSSYTAEKTYLWPTVLPEDTDKPVTVKGNRIYQCGSQYYYAEEDFILEWDDDLLRNAEAFSDHLLCLSQGLIYMEGDNLTGIVPGAVFRHHDQFWVYDTDEAAAEPMEKKDGWIEISDLFEEGKDDYDPGADTGPESDALSYPDAQFNPYPGTLSTNCTYAVWALANQALGVRLPNWGDAGNWYRRAGISGYPTGQNPAPYSIVVWDHHVGFVTAVSEDGTMMYVKEGNASGRYREAWWPAASSRHGQDLYGFIYLTNDHGDAIQADTVEVTEGYEGIEEEFLATLGELGLEPGERTEAYSDEVEEGYIISYTTGELAVGSVVDYVVSLGPKPEVVIDDDVMEDLVGMTKDELLAWFDKNGLIAGIEAIEESDQETGIVLRVAKGSYKEGEEVNFTTSRKKAEPGPDPTTEPTAEPEPSIGPDPTTEPTGEPEPSEEPVDTPATPPTPSQEPSPSEEPLPPSDPVPSEDPIETTPPVPESSSEPVVETTPEPTASAEAEIQNIES